MYSYLKSEKRILFTILCDVFVICGVLFFNWSPARMIAFYFLEMCIVLFSYIIFNFILDPNTSVFIWIFDFFISIFGMLLISVILGISFYSVLKLIPGFKLSMVSIKNIYYPYVDMPFFLLSMISAQVANVKKYLSVDPEIAKRSFTSYLAIHVCMIPIIIIITLILRLFSIEIRFALILSLLLFRNAMEYIRYKTFVNQDPDSVTNVANL